MTKTGKVTPHETPSVVSGRAATHVVDGEPVCRGEDPEAYRLEKLAKAFKETQAMLSEHQTARET